MTATLVEVQGDIQQLEQTLANLRKQRQVLAFDSRKDTTAKETLRQTEARIADTEKELELARLALDEARIREADGRKVRCTALIQQLQEMLAGLDRQFAEALETAKDTESAEDVDRTVLLFMQTYSLAHALKDLFPAAEQAQFHRGWDIRSMLLDLAEKSTILNRPPFTPRPHIEQPWHPLLEEIHRLEAQAS